MATRGVGGLDGRTGCDKCGIGKVNQFEGKYACANAEPGTYANEYGLLVAYDCPTGYHSIEDRSRCEACAKGKYNDAIRMSLPTDCKLCPKGFYRDTVAGKSLDDCTACEPGKYNPSTRRCSRVECQDCDRGQFQSDFGGSLCFDCPRGWRESIGLANCTQCSNGSVAATDGLEQCTSCLAGQYEEGKVKCKFCPAGYSQSSSDANFCAKCAAGSVSGIIQTFCTACSPGQYEKSHLGVHRLPFWLVPKLSREGYMCDLPDWFRCDIR